MPMWYGHWGFPWMGFGWIFPVIVLGGMILMMFVCMRGRGTMFGRGRHQQGGPSEIEALRREVQALRDEIRAARDRA